jgi:Zn-dependent M28 family amino/carboxypeptidase
MALNTYEPMMSNSDHYNFARHGIPALRLVAGFDRPESNIKYILTRSDTRDKVDISHLRSAAMMTAALLGRALTASDADMASLRQR